MAKDTSPKCKKCRREGAKLFLKGERCYTSKCAIVKRKYPPGQHGPKGTPRISEYGLQLREKQKAKRTYGLLERQFRNYYQKASKIDGDTGEILLQFLELRLDNIIYRLGLAPSRANARQLVNHGHFLINGRPTKIPSRQLKVNDKIQIKEKSQKSRFFEETKKTMQKKEIPSWLSLDQENLSAKVAKIPVAEELEQSINSQLIIEYYSR